MDKKSFVEDLLLWFRQNKRDMPWRETKDPYHIWISEIMLQQTRVETVRDYYQRFIQNFPTVEDLATASEESVLKSWEGLGYYSRGRNLHRAAKLVIQEFGGKVPNQLKELQRLPGIGDYTAGAILSIAFNQPIPAVDGNVLRVFSRLYCIEKDIMEKTTVEEIRRLVKELMPAQDCGDFSEALMELGALICNARNPKCGFCPVQGHCISHREEKAVELPIRISKTKVKKLKMGIFWIRFENQILVKKNPEQGLLAGLWALPTFSLTEEKNQEAVLERLKEGIPKITTIEYSGKASHIFTHQRWDIDIYLASCSTKEFPDHRGIYKWVNEEQLKELALPTLYRKIVKKLLKQ